MFRTIVSGHPMRRRDVIRFLAAAGGWAQWTRIGGALLPLSVTATQDKPEKNTPLLPLFPLPLVLFPGVNLPLHIFEPRYKEMIADCLQNHWEFGILLARDERVENIGCTASISEVLRRYPDGRMDILVHGRRRFEVALLNREKSYLRGRPEFFLEDLPSSVDSQDKALVDPNESKLRLEAVRLHGRLMKMLAESPSDPTQEEPRVPQGSKPEPSFDPNVPRLSFQMMSEFPADLEWKQKLLEIRLERERLVRVIDYLERLIDYIEEKEPRAPVNRV